MERDFTKMSDEELLAILRADPQPSGQQPAAPQAAPDMTQMSEADLRDLAAGKPLKVTIGRRPQPKDDIVVSTAKSMAGDPLGVLALNAADGFLMGGGDELFSGGDPERMAQLHALKLKMREESPIASTIGNMVGGIASFVPAGRLVSTAAKGIGLGLKGINAANAGVGILQGTAAGALDSNEDRATGAQLGALFSLAGEAGGAALASRLAKRGAPGAADMAIADAVTDSAAALGVLEEAERLGSPAALADASPTLRSLAGQTVSRSEDAGRLATDAIGGRDTDAINRAVATVDSKLAKETNVVTLGKSIRSEGSAAVDDLYKDAFSRAAPVADPNLNAILKRPAVKQGLDYAKTIAANRGKDWGKMGVDLDAQGNIVLKKGASFESLDLVKRGIDDYMDTFRNEVTGVVEQNNTTRAVEAARSALVARMRELNPDYGSALDIYAPFGARASALERGGKALTATSVNAKQIAETVGALSADELAAFQIGAANNIIDTLKKAKDNADPFQFFRSTDMRERLTAIFPDKAGELADIKSVVDMEGYMRRTREALLGGSATQGRQVASRAFEAQAEAAPGILARTAEVGAAVATNGISMLPQLIRTGRLKASDAAKLETVKNQEALAKDLAPILMETDPKKAREALNDILDRVDKYNRKSQQTRRTGASVGAAVGTGILAEQ